MKRRLLLYLSYIGTHYKGLQALVVKGGYRDPLVPRAPDIQTVQGILEHGLKKILNINDVTVFTSSRTDAGVHALSTTVHIDVDEIYFAKVPYSPERLCQSLNLFLEKNETEIRANRIVEVPLDFICRRAFSRTYIYRIALTKANDFDNCPSLSRLSSALPITELNRCQVINQPFDVSAVQSACRVFVGQWNFRSFMKPGGKELKFKIKESKKDVVVDEDEFRFCIKTIYRFSFSKSAIDDRYIDSRKLDFYDFNIEGSGFLRRQVRRMVGALIGVGNATIEPKDILWMLQNPSEKSWNPRCSSVNSHVIMENEEQKQEGTGTSTSSMSFLSQLQRKAGGGLKPTSTRVTSLDGTVQTLIGQASILSPHDAQVSKKFGFVVDTKPDLTIGEVRPWLFISSQDVPNDVNIIRQFGITNILSLLPGFVLDSQTKQSVSSHLSLEIYDDLDFRLDSEVISKALEYVHKCHHNGEKVLVHCNAGISRAPSIVMLYLIKYESLSYDEAWKEVKVVRPFAKPNDGFLQQLLKFSA